MLTFLCSRIIVPNNNEDVFCSFPTFKLHWSVSNEGTTGARGGKWVFVCLRGGYII